MPLSVLRCHLWCWMPLQVGELVALVAPALGCDRWHSVELWVGARRLDEPSMLLRDAGVKIDPRTGCHVKDVLASLPHLIS